MSIIHEALKKVEQNISTNNRNKTKKNKRWFYLFVYTSLMILGFSAANFIYNTINQPLPKKENNSFSKKNKPDIVHKDIVYKEDALFLKDNSTVITPEVKKTSEEELMLNGIFYDPQNPYVIINDRVLKKGDYIKGYLIKNIYKDKVELYMDNQTVELKMQN